MPKGGRSRRQIERIVERRKLLTLNRVAEAKTQRTLVSKTRMDLRFGQYVDFV